MRRNGAGIDQGICITSYAGQCRTVDQVVVCRMALPGKAGTQPIAGPGFTLNMLCKNDRAGGIRTHDSQNIVHRFP
jgi:hypothetical protein